MKLHEIAVEGLWGQPHSFQIVNFQLQERLKEYLETFETTHSQPFESDHELVA
jgi:hypothetical protein